ncbi:MAG TPA: type IV toxin-antitoxin system AbiEi family antitoxin domain-containing protein [Actinomycetota bacterium]|nr:type IV toxin-antitoxin system AbiEi family antitoxin domain-containing protein [Actinomycetota bacterium]
MPERRPAPDARLVVATRAQHGPFTRAQARAAGFSDAGIKSRLASGRWVRLHRGVLCEATVPPSLRRDASAAVLACGSRAAASHRTAALLWELDVPAPDRPEVTVVGATRREPSGLLVHRTSRLTRVEAGVRDGIRVCSPMRTLLGLGEVLEPRLVELALDRLWRRGRVHPSRLLSYLDEPWCRRRRGTRVLRGLVRERMGVRATDSDLETLLVQVLREAGLPLPERQYPVATPFGPRYLDLAYPQQRIAIETDGMDSRLDPEVFLDERARQNLIEAQGWTFRRFGYAHVTNDPLWTVFTVAQALGVRPVRWVQT